MLAQPHGLARDDGGDHPQGPHHLAAGPIPVIGAVRNELQQRQVAGVRAIGKPRLRNDGPQLLDARTVGIDFSVARINTASISWITLLSAATAVSTISLAWTARAVPTRLAAMSQVFVFMKFSFDWVDAAPRWRRALQVGICAGFAASTQLTAANAAGLSVGTHRAAGLHANMTKPQWGENQQMKGLLTAQRQLPVLGQWQLDMVEVVLKSGGARMLDWPSKAWDGSCNPLFHRHVINRQ